MISIKKLTALKKQLFIYLCFVLSGAVCDQNLYAATNRGIEFRDHIKVAGENLSLHGIGLLKWKYLFKVYLVALYKPEQINVSDILKDIPKRLEYYFFVDMKASDFQDTGFQLMAMNVGEEKAMGFTGKLEALNRLYRDVEAGQRYTLTYLPDTGIEMALDGEVLGQVQGAEFAAAYFAIWLGANPVSRGLKEGVFDPLTLSQ